MGEAVPEKRGCVWCSVFPKPGRLSYLQLSRKTAREVCGETGHSTNAEIPSGKSYVRCSHCHAQRHWNQINKKLTSFWEYYCQSHNESGLKETVTIRDIKWPWLPSRPQARSTLRKQLTPREGIFSNFRCRQAEQWNKKSLEKPRKGNTLKEQLELNQRRFPILEVKQSDRGFREWVCHEQTVAICYLMYPFGDESIRRGHPAPVHHCILGLWKTPPWTGHDLKVLALVWTQWPIRPFSDLAWERG